jgi:inositol transport system ATP-binding protein
MNTSAPILEFKDISKKFDEVYALQDVSFSIPKGGVHALVGENGAGKSTLIRICGGILAPNKGELHFEGQRVQFRSASDARGAGISIVHQEIPICPHLTAAENIYLGRPLPTRMGMIDTAEMNRHVQALFERLQVNISPTAVAGRLPIALQQMIEIAQALSLQSKLLIMDEPTSALGKKETDRLFEIIRQLTEQGITIIYVSHRLEEVFEIADDIITLRDGRYIDTVKTQDTTPDKVVELMVGREITDLFPKNVQPVNDHVMLSVRHLTVPGLFEDVSFDLHKGEVLGLVGLQGSGTSEILSALFGRYTNSSGEVHLNGQPVNVRSPLEAIKHGIAYVPADRQGEGLFRPLSVGENAGLLILKQISRILGWVPQRPLNQHADKAVNEFGIRTASTGALVSSLSGGNQQKVVVARTLSTEPIVILMDDPTRGVDVGAKAEIHHILNGIVAQGNSVILVSSELPEVLAMSDRVIVLYKGKIQGELPREQAERELVMGLATGAVNAIGQ